MATFDVDGRVAIDSLMMWSIERWGGMERQRGRKLTRDVE